MPNNNSALPRSMVPGKVNEPVGYISAFADQNAGEVGRRSNYFGFPPIMCLTHRSTGINMEQVEPSIGDSMAQYTTFDIVRQLGINRGRLREWMNGGFTSPSVRTAVGVGTKALFDDIDILGMLTFKTLIEDHKIARSEAAQMVKEWSRVVRLFREIVGDGMYQNFLGGYDLFRVVRKNGKLVVGQLVAFDIVSKFLLHQEDGGKYRKRFSDVLGEEFVQEVDDLGAQLYLSDVADIISGVRSKKDPRMPSFNEYFKPEERLTWDSLLILNFSKIKQEAAKIKRV
jgi:hypothetical protein